MVKKAKQVVWSASKLGVRALGIFMFLIIMLTGAFVWRVSDSPLDISFAKSYIEKALHDKVSGRYGTMDRAVLFWSSLKGPLYLQIHNSRIFSADGALLGSAGQLDISFSRMGLLRGRIMPKALIVKQPTVRLTRKEDGSFSFDVGDVGDVEKGVSDSKNADSNQDAIHEILSYMANPKRSESVLGESLIAQLQGFFIEDARLFIDDKMLQQTWSLPDFDVAFVSTEKGAQARAHMALPFSLFEPSGMDVRMDYDWAQGSIFVVADVRALNVNDIIAKIPGLDVPATQKVIVGAHIETVLDDKTFTPSDMQITVHSKGGEIAHSMLSDEPLVYEDLALNATYNYAGKLFQLSDTHVSLGGVAFHFSGDLMHSARGIKGPVKVWAKDVSHASIDALWPNFLRGEDAEKWIVQRMADGVFTELSAGFDLDVVTLEDEEEGAENVAVEVANLQADISNLVVDFKAKDMTLDYRSPMPKAQNIYGSGHFDVDNDTLSIDVEKAKIAGLSVGVSSLYFDKLVEEGVGDADLKFSLNGHLADVLRYISGEPINMGDDISMDIEKVEGTADLKVGLYFPARNNIKLSQFKIDITGTLFDVLFPAVVKGLDITGGPLALAVKDNAISVQGGALLDGRQADLSWDAFLKSKGEAYKEKVQVRLVVDDALRGKFGIDLSDFLEGPLDTALTYTSYQDGRARAEVSAEAAMARLFIDPFDYEKVVGEAGHLRFNALLENGTLQRLTDLSADAPDFALEGGVLNFVDGKEGVVLAGGTFPSVALGETKGALEFSYDDNRAVDIRLNASVLDARPFMNSEEKQEDYTAPPLRITVRADEMRTGAQELQRARDARIYLDIDRHGRFNQVEVDGHVGTSDVFVRYNDEGNAEGKRTFRMKTEDAGALLRAFGLYDNVVGGTMVIYGEPMRWVFDRNIRGKAEISGFKVVKAPALTKLLSLLSLGGITERLTSDGLNFENLEADFNWLYHRQGSLLKLKNGRTSGNTLGLLFEGTFDNHKREVDVSGTIAPMDGLNSFLGKIPLVGEILTGGSGLFAATYSIKGPSDEPQITVNPLSVLTPGILRRILWEK